ncbi:MAG TPA: DEAD/DEAH box helicase [Bacteriovoracaceae bacterium]|nr:DEAD/DEAH box helicase [Bacteriovoracaceae bacterium]
MNRPSSSRRRRRGNNRPPQQPPPNSMDGVSSGDGQPNGPLTLEQRCVRQFHKTSLGRGRQYFASGRVSEPTWNGRECTLFVHGAGGDYKVQFDFSQAAEAGLLPARCGCPLYARGTICKHLWTSILQIEKVSRPEMIPESGLLKIVRERPAPLQERNDRGARGQARGQHQSPDRTHQAEPISPRQLSAKSVPGVQDSANWMERLAQLQGMATHPAARTSVSFSSCFVVSAFETASTGKLVMDLWTRSRSISGELGPLRPNRVSAQGVSELYDLIDQEILSTLIKTSNPQTAAPSGRGSGNATTRFTVDSILEGHLLPLLANSGKLYLSRSPNGVPDSAERPLRMDRGAPWDLELKLAPSGPEYYRLDATLVRSGEFLAVSTPLAILGGGFLLFDERIGRFTEVRHANWAMGFQGPSEFLVPRDQGDQLLTRILLDPSSPRITWSEELGWTKVIIEPKPSGVFRPLGGDPLIGRMTLTVSFDYAGRDVPLSELETSFVDAEQKKVYKRNQDFEEKTLLEALKILRDPQGTGSVPTGDLHRAANELVLAGWTIFIENQRLRVPHDFSMNVSSSTDWFDLRMDLDFGDVSMTRGDLLTALQAQNGLVKLSDGSLGMLPQDWSSRYASLSQFGEMTAEGSLRFSKSQGLMLSSVLNENDRVHADEGFQSFRTKIGKFEGVKIAKAPAGFVGELRNYQKDGLSWLRFLEEFETGGILADDMGLGKTIQILAFLLGRTKKKKTKRPHLVVTPKSLAFNWIDEAQKFTPTLKVVRYSGAGRSQVLADLQEVDIVVTTYGTLRTDIDKLQAVDFDVAIIDEAQAIKNPKSQAAVACKQLKASLKIALTGTPIENSITDLLSILEFTNPGLLSAKEVKQDTQAALAKMLRPFMLRRTKEKVLTELPDRSEQVLYCEMGAVEKQFYAAIRERYRASLAEKIEKSGLGRSKMHVLETLLRLRQAACHPGLIDPKRVSEPSAKIQQLLRHMQEVIQEGHKVLVFSQFTSLLAIVRARLEEEKIDYEYLDGQTEDRKSPVERFQNDPACPAFLISLKAGGTGLNLTAADYVFILDPWWNPAVEAQAIGRAHRMGQTNKVIAYRMISKGTVEEKILVLQKTKKEIAESIVSEDQDFMKKLTKEDLEMLLE